MRFMLSMSKRVVLGLSILLLAVSSFVLNMAPANAATSLVNVTKSAVYCGLGHI